MNKIFIENYTLVSKHGYYREEHFKPQRFIVSVSCEVKENDSAAKDDLKATFNYEEIRKIIDNVIKGEHKKLLETLCEEIASQILKFQIVKKVEVKITKPDIWGDCEPGVTILREKRNFLF